ncbi:MAG: PCMD domain-containing protein [Bacteroidaceae bacterium]|nr:PCMD domain-containing protein [Bacteroidaceae bacterium]
MNKTFLVALAAVPLFFASCIPAENPNSECDIEAVSLHLDTPIDYFYHEYDTMQTVISTETDIVFTIRSYANIQNVPTTLRVTDRASVYVMTDEGTQVPFQNGSSVDFSDEKVYHFRVVAEDKVWHRDYTISVVHDTPSEGNLFFDFETYALDASGKYYVWEASEVFTDGIWKNGNPGFKISKSSAMPMEYPSTPVAGGGPDGSDCVKLETCDTGPFGRMVNMRLASGSMFNGIFDVGNALTDALKATQFGTPFTHKPVMLRAWLRFESGSVYQDREGNPIEGVVDEPDIYFVLYRNEDESGNKVQLDGNDVLTNSHIVGFGRLPHNYNPDGTDLLSANPVHGLTNEWQEVTIPMEYRAELDDDILANKGYSLVISFASSWQGGDFMGAIGSKFYIDNVQMYCE